MRVPACVRPALALFGVSLALAACGLPPINTPEQSFAIPYKTFVPALATGIPLLTGLPEFADQKAPPVTFPLPKEAKSFKLETVVLNLKFYNTGPLPLRIKLFLSTSAEDPFAKPPLGGDQALIDLPRGGETISRSFPIDVALMQADNLKLGYTFGSPGTKESVTFKDMDEVKVTHSIKVQAKLL